ncbi:hypothetical protein Golob_022873 [Gossypium lobatum]|uniref:Uncharacterized protein n=1 Tax=Gossypium lobatum TaxID=34289 RepID=A0A7J8LHW1_9ROSI|nr:hypothetical protein [Gossypium lobatum]
MEELKLDDGEEEAQSRRATTMNRVQLKEERDKEESSKGLGQIDMEHDLEESSIKSGDGKKRPRMDILDPNVSNNMDLLVSNYE